jgi:hypothetical protein
MKSNALSPTGCLGFRPPPGALFNRRTQIFPLVSLFAFILAYSASANMMTFSATGIWEEEGSPSQPLAAEATFIADGSTLTVTLSNTSLEDVLFQGTVLTTVSFDLAGTPDLTPVSAILGPGSAVVSGSTGGSGSDPGGVVGGEWGFVDAGTHPLLGNAMYGIGTAGMGIFSGGSFPGSNLEGPEAVNGIAYGLTSAGDDPTTGQSIVSGARSLIQNSVVFTFSGLPQDFDVTSDVSNVRFAYGTTLGEAIIPEPATIGLLLVGLAAVRRRRLA